MDAPDVKFKVTDLTASVGKPSDGISFVIGKTLRGPVNDPSEIFNNWTRFLEVHGGFQAGDDTALLVRMLLDKGGRVRFCNLGHYTTISNASTLTALVADADDPIISDSEDEDELFELVLKAPGADGNNFSVVISNASNGMPEYFNVSILHALEPALNKTYPNIIIEGSPTAGEASFLSDITDGSTFMNVVYKDLSSLVGPLRPANQTITYAGGTNGGAIVDADIIGDSASNTGFHAFDDYDDAYQVICVLNTISDAVVVAGDAYAFERDDLMWWYHLPNSLTDKAALITKRNTLDFSSKYTAFFAGGVKTTNPVNSQPKDVSGIADIAALAGKSDTNFGVYYSFAGSKRGVITGRLGVVNNFGTPGKKKDLNELANRQINCIVKTGGLMKLKSQFTTLVKKSQEQFIQVVRGTFYVKKALYPLLDEFLEEPNDMTSWKLMYYQVKVFLDQMVENRALYSYRWEGDQFATTLAELVVNNAADVSNGKYKVKLFLSWIVGMQEIEVNLILTPGNLSFELANELT